MTSRIVKEVYMDKFRARAAAEEFANKVGGCVSVLMWRSLLPRKTKFHHVDDGVVLDDSCPEVLSGYEVYVGGSYRTVAKIAFVN